MKAKIESWCGRGDSNPKIGFHRLTPSQAAAFSRFATSSNGFLLRLLPYSVKCIIPKINFGPFVSLPQIRSVVGRHPENGHGSPWGRRGTPTAPVPDTGLGSKVGTNWEGVSW